MNILLHPTYFPSISHYVAMMKADKITFEMEDNFQKQSNRNRMYIYSPNGIQLLNVPVKKSNQRYQKYKEVKIENDFDWQKNHWKSIEAAYRSSPYFEFFEDDFIPLFEKKHNFILDLNFELFDIVNEALGVDLSFEKTTEYFHESAIEHDFRPLVNGKKDNFKNEEYIQVFREKEGFIPNLSILDLLFNEGRHAVDYLKKQQF